MMGIMVWLNSSGCLTAFAYWMAVILFISLNPRKYKGLPLYGICSAFLVFTVAFSLMIDGKPFSFFLLAFLGVWALQFVMFRICCAITLYNLFYFIFRAFIVGEFTSALEFLLYKYFIAMVSGNYQVFFGFLLLLLVNGSCFAIIYVLERRYQDYFSRLIIEKKELLSVFLIACGIYLFSNISNVFQNTPFSSNGASEILLIRTLADLGGIVMLYAYQLQLYERHDVLQIQMLQQIMEQQKTNYLVSEQSIRLIHQKYHDLKHQIDFLRSDIQSGEKLAYLDQMEQDIRSFEAQMNTGNKILDTILMTKSLQCQNLGIQFTTMVNGKCMYFMEPMDLNALFGNLLDNAMEGTLQVEDAGNRWIHVRVEQKKKFIVIGVVNSCMENVIFENGVPVTQKPDKQYHGFGVQSIRSILEKYGGAAVFLQKDGYFEMKGTLPEKTDNN